MAFTANQQAILDRAKNRLGGRQDDEEETQNGLTERQRELLEASKARLGDRYQSRESDQGSTSDMASGFLGGIDSMQGTAYGLAGLAGDALERSIGVGEGLRDWGFKGYQDNMAEVDDTFRDAYTWDGATDSVGNFIDAGQYYVGRVVPDAVAALGSGLVGGIIAKKAVSEGTEAVIKNKTKDLLGDRIGDKVTKEGIGSTVGVVAQGVGQSTGGIYGQAGEKAIAEGGTLEDVNLGKVAAGGLAAGLVESGADILTLGLGGFGVGKNLLDVANTGGKVRRVATKGTIGAGAEAVTEGIQTGIEDLGAGETLADARFMDPTAMMAGAFGGGAVSGAGGVRKPTNQGTQFAEEEAMRMAEEEAELIRQQEEEAKAEGLRQQEEIKEQGRARREAAQTFTPRNEFIKARQAEITAQQEQDILDPNTELGQAFETHLNEQGIYDDADTLKEAKSFLKGYQKQNDSAQQIAQEYVTALDEHVGAVARAKEIIAQNPDVMAMDDDSFVAASEQDPEAFLAISRMRTNAQNAAAGTVDTTTNSDTTATQEALVEKPKKLTKKQQLRQMATDKLGETWEQDNPELSQLFSDGKGIYSRGKGKKSRFETMVDKIAAERAAQQTPVDAEATTEALPTIETPTVETTANTEAEATTTEQAETTETPPILTGMDAQAVSYATEKLGPNWRTENPELVPVLEDKKYAGFQSNVDRIAASRPATTETAVSDTEAATAVDNLFAQPLPSGVKLSANEQKVFDVLNEAFQNNEQDDVVQSDGSLNPQRIADRAGLKSRQAAQTAITRLRPKIAKAYNLDQNQIKQRLADTRVKDVQQFDQNAADSELELSELGDSMGTVASANQGARDGMSPEDQAFIDDMEDTPVQQQTPEELAAVRAEFDEEMKADRAYKPAADLWDNGFESDVENEADRIPFDSMDAGSRFEWLAFATEYNDGNIDLDALGREYDFIRADFIKDKENAQREITDQSGPVESQGNTQETDAIDSQVREEGARLEQSEERADSEQESVAYVDGKPVTVGNKPVITVRKSRKKTAKKFSRKDSKSDSPITVEELKDKLRERFGRRVVRFRGGELDTSPGTIYSPLQVHATVKDAVRALGGSMTREELQDAQAFIDPNDSGVAHFIAENMTKDTADGVIDHEVGVHLGIEVMMNTAQVQELSGAVQDWQNADEGSVERTIYERAMARVAFARATGMDESLSDVELIAYAVEEAVNAGVKPSKKAESVAAKWLQDIYNFFSTLKQRWFARNNQTDERVEVTSAEELVALARGAARANMQDRTVLERGADPNTMDEQTIMEYYGGVDKNRTLADDARVFYGASSGLGTEIFDWGTDSKYGPYTDIETSAKVVDDGTQFFQIEVTDSEGDVITTLQLKEEAPNLYSLAVVGPINTDSENTSTTMDTRGGSWKRLEGVTHSQNMRLLTEARRRLTRLNRGVVPNIMFERVTGAAAGSSANVDSDRLGEEGGRLGAVFMDEARKRFSKKEKKASKERTSKLGEWARDNFGATGKQFLDDAAEVAKQGTASLKFLHQYVRDVKDRMPAANDMYQAIKEADKTRQDIRRQVESIAVRARELSPERLAAVNDFISKSTFYQTWGYDPQFTDENGNQREITVNETMRLAYERLDAKEQAIVREIFQHGENMRVRKREIAAALGVDKSFFSAAELDGPYAPLKRFGNYAGVLKSQALLDAEDNYANAQTDRERKVKREIVENMKSQQEHYVVSFFDTMGAAKKFTDENRGDYATAVPSQRTDDLMSDRVSNEEVFQKVLGGLSAADNIDAKSKTAFAEMVRDMYFDSLDERDARRTGSQRKNRAGYEKNMIRSFLSHARAEAGMISTMEHGAEINTALAEAKKQSDKDPEALKPVYNMLVAHYKDSLAYQDTAFQRIQDRIAAMNSVYMLTSSIGYHVTNATQPAMVTVPRLAGDFGDYSGAWGKLTRGYKVAVAAARMTKQFETEIDLNKVPPKYRKLLEELQLRNLLDVGMEEDLSSFDRFNTGYESLNVASDKLGMVTHKLYQAARLVEAHNRISSAVAAYDMASANPQVANRQGMTPAEYAISVVEDTQGNFSRMDAPLLVKALPKLTTQYRKYQLMMAWAYTNAVKQTFKGESPEMKAMGRRTLAYMTAHAGLFAGATGIPLVSTVAPYILAFSTGEDEPQDLDRWIMTNVPGKTGEVLSKGVFNFIGIDMSTKLSQGKIFDPFPYLDYDVSEDGVKDLVFNLAAGPSGTTMINFTRSAEYFAQGDVLKGIEYMVPKGIRSATESYRMATEGISFKNGDIVVDPRDVDVKSLLINALGLPASEINKVKWTRSQQYELEQYFSEETSRLRREYIDAKRDRDRSAQKELRAEWKDLQQQKKRVRPFFGRDRKTLRPQPVTSLMKAPYQQTAREKRAAKRFE